MVPPACIGLGRNSLEFFYSRNKIPIMFSQIEVSGYQPIYKIKIKQDYNEGISAFLVPIFYSHFYFGPTFLFYHYEYVFGFKLKSQLILLFSLFLLLFMSFITLFGTIHRSHCIISTNFYLYLQYFQ